MTYSMSCGASSDGETRTRERLSSYIASSSSDDSAEETASRSETDEPPSEGGAEGTVIEGVENRVGTCSTTEWADDEG